MLWQGLDTFVKILNFFDFFTISGGFKNFKNWNFNIHKKNEKI
jgi:hypothetical protein